eukprot:TRINITY_DN1230_c0_g1_i1.p1 TRINITY_DN1230_c0_g1~~TRINITY_DN1230_c0_g1_i1.p1  ORF type:complete len:1000 (+),score=80.24 TRINITY_DN1230_c0_g1_i1:84-3002(+)
MLNAEKEKKVFLTGVSSKDTGITRNLKKINMLQAQLATVINNYKEDFTKKLERIDNDLLFAYKVELLKLEKVLSEKKEIFEKQATSLSEPDKETETLETAMNWFKNQAEILASHCSYQTGCLEYLRNHVKEIEEDIKDLEAKLQIQKIELKELEQVSGQDIKVKPSQTLLKRRPSKVPDNPTPYLPKICYTIRYFLSQHVDKCMVTETVVKYFNETKSRDRSLIQSLKKKLVNTKDASISLINEKACMKNGSRSRMKKLFLKSIEKVREQITKRAFSVKKLTQRGIHRKIRSSSVVRYSSNQGYKVASEDNTKTLEKFSAADKRAVLQEFITQPEVHSYLLRIIALELERNISKKLEHNTVSKSKESSTKAQMESPLRKYHASYLNPYSSASNRYKSETRRSSTSSRTKDKVNRSMASEYSNSISRSEYRYRTKSRAHSNIRSPQPFLYTQCHSCTHVSIDITLTIITLYPIVQILLTQLSKYHNFPQIEFMGCGNSSVATAPTRKVSAATEDIVIDFTKASNPHNFKFQKIIGHGRYGRVLLGYSTTNNTSVAIKVLEKSQNLSKLLEEVKLLSEVDHPNIVKYFFNFQTEKRLYIIMEHCGGGDLFEKVISKSHFSEKQAAQIMREILRGVNHCHHLGIIHRDLKPENIMVSAEGQIKIIDFGFSISGTSECKEELVGTSFYIAPEVLKTFSYTKACDIWSLGIILHILLSGYIPIEGRSRQEVFLSIEAFKEPTFVGWNNVSSNAKDLVRRMLQPDPKKRITAADALKHPWFNCCEEEAETCDLEIISSLKKYSGYSKLRKRALNILVHYIKEKDIMKFQKMFIKLDTNNTGLITCKELQMCLKSEGYDIPAEELEDLAKNVSYEGDAFINYTDFLAATLATQVFFTEEKLWELFKTLDSENKGGITKVDLRKLLYRRKRVPTMELEGIMNLADTNKDGKISFDEFKDVVMSENCQQLIYIQSKSAHRR